MLSQKVSNAGMIILFWNAFIVSTMLSFNTALNVWWDEYDKTFLPKFVAKNCKH